MPNSISNQTRHISSHSNDSSQDSTQGNGKLPPSFWQRYRAPVLLTVVGGAVDTIGFIALFGFFTAHVTGNLVMAGSGLVKGEAGLWIKLAALPLFVLTVMVTKTFIDKSKKQTIDIESLVSR